MLTDHDIFLFRQGTHRRLAGKLGCVIDASGAQFGVWAPNARSVAVIGDFNEWNAATHPLRPREDGSGIWEGSVAGIRRGDSYKFRIVSNHDGFVAEKADPFALLAQEPPETASRAWTLEYEWHDADWMAGRRTANALAAPQSVYEVHLGSWRRAEGGGFLNYRQMGDALAQYVVDLGFTHVELMPVTEHPFYGSWGYQTTGYFAPTARYGTPQDFMYLIDVLHRAGIGVILDWVPSHFPSDGHGLAYFDGTHLFEHADPQQGFHPEWKSSIFNYGRHEVRAFLLSSALFWLDQYHIDGIRVDGVASMLYLDYGRKHGEWVANEHGGRENLEAVSFLRDLNAATYGDHPDTETIAEESTAWPMVSRPVYLGGLGFGMKWNMGWMHDSLAYMSQDPLYRKYHHGRLTFSIWYAFAENFMLPLSHDEVVYGKGSLIGKMPGDTWQKFANLRALFGYMWGHPGKKLLFMGGEFGQRREWAHDEGLEWGLLQHPEHAGLQRWVSDLNHMYRIEPALHEVDFQAEGFEWIDCNDAEASVITFLRKARDGRGTILVACNMTPLPRMNYIVGVPEAGYWRELLCSDATLYGGSGVGNYGGVESSPVSAHGRYHSVALTLPPLGVVFLKHDRDDV